MQRPERSDESTVEIFLDEVTEGLEFRLGKGIDRFPRQRCAFFQVDFKIIRMVGCKVVSLSFTKNISKVMILGRNIGKVNRVLLQLCLVSGSGIGNIRKVNTETV